MVYLYFKTQVFLPARQGKGSMPGSLSDTIPLPSAVNCAGGGVNVISMSVSLAVCVCVCCFNVIFLSLIV